MNVLMSVLILTRGLFSFIHRTFPCRTPQGAYEMDSIASCYDLSVVTFVTYVDICTWTKCVKAWSSWIEDVQYVLVSTSSLPLSLLPFFQYVSSWCPRSPCAASETPVELLSLGLSWGGMRLFYLPSLQPPTLSGLWLPMSFGDSPSPRMPSKPNDYPGSPWFEVITIS